MFSRISFALALGALLAACATNKPSSTPAPSMVGASREPCPDIALANWQLVRAPGFLLCLPPGYSAPRVGTMAESRNGDNRIRWGIGEPPSEPMNVSITVDVRSGESLEAAAQRTIQHRNWAENVGGREVSLATVHVLGNNYVSGAVWKEPKVFVSAISKDPGSAQMQLRAIRTVQFLP